MSIVHDAIGGNNRTKRAQAAHYGTYIKGLFRFHRVVWRVRLYFPMSNTRKKCCMLFYTIQHYVPAKNGSYSRKPIGCRKQHRLTQYPGNTVLIYKLIQMNRIHTFDIQLSMLNLSTSNYFINYLNFIMSSRRSKEEIAII